MRAYSGVFLCLCFFGCSASSSSIETENLPLVAQTVYGTWNEQNRLFPDSVFWNGSSFVLREESGDLILVTNRHCLGLDDVMQAGSLRLPSLPPEGTGLEGLLGSAVEAVGSNVERILDPAVIVGSYQLAVVFDSGREVAVEAFRFAENADIALLRIPGTGLREGHDYRIPVLSPDPVRVGSEVAAVGAPYNLSSSVTFGRISALRSYPSSYGNTTIKFLQTDAAINSGNSGGPLMVADDSGKYWLAGINTMRHNYGEGLGLAIDFSEMENCVFSPWLSADKDGMIQALEIQN